MFGFLRDLFSSSGYTEARYSFDPNYKTETEVTLSTTPPDQTKAPTTPKLSPAQSAAIRSATKRAATKRTKRPRAATPIVDTPIYDDGISDALETAAEVAIISSVFDSGPDLSFSSSDDSFSGGGGDFGGGGAGGDW